MRRPPAKSRRQQPPCLCKPSGARAAVEPPPFMLSNVAALVERHDNGDGHGPFGFTQHVLP